MKKKKKKTTIGLSTSSDKTKFISFNQDSVISSFNVKPLKLVNQFIYFGSNISSTEAMST